MAGLSRKRFISKLTRSPLAYIILILILALFTWSAIGAYQKSRVSRNKLINLESELASLEVQKEKLSLELTNANTPFGQEKAIREKFNVVKEGEKVIMIVSEDKNAGEDEEEKEGGLRGFWRRIFKK